MGRKHKKLHFQMKIPRPMFYDPGSSFSHFALTMIDLTIFMLFVYSFFASHVIPFPRFINFKTRSRRQTPLNRARWRTFL